MKRINFEIAWQAFVQWTKASLFMAIGLTLFRLVVYMTCFQHRTGFSGEVIQAFFAGIRFDLLILGFFWIPAWFWLWAMAVSKKPNWIFQPLRFYWSMSWLLYFLFQLCDLFFTAAHGYRLNKESSQIDVGQMVLHGWQELGSLRAIFAVVALAIVYVAVFRRMVKLTELPAKETGKAQIAFKMIFSLLAVALAARGTVTAHHLNIEHAIVSSSNEINQISLNPVWNSDKK